MEVTDKEIIKSKIKSVYGDDLEFGLFEIKENELILATPFLDNEDNLIEIGIFFKESGKVIVSDLGKISLYLRQLNIKDKKNKLDFSGLKSVNAINISKSNKKKRKKNKDHDDLDFYDAVLNKFYEITADYESIGSNVKRILKLLQKVYSLTPYHKKGEIKDDKIVPNEDMKFKYYLKNNLYFDENDIKFRRR
ncbi:MAG: hypothetical protein PHR39_07965 [Actinomycetota bacterium]|nr:hypothetical protein [Actinomycetota bacterium]